MKKSIIETILGLVIVLGSIASVVVVLTFMLLAAQACLSSEAFDLTLKVITGLILVPAGIGMIINSREIGASLMGHKEKK